MKTTAKKMDPTRLEDMKTLFFNSRWFKESEGQELLDEIERSWAEIEEIAKQRDAARASERAALVEKERLSNILCRVLPAALRAVESGGEAAELIELGGALAGLDEPTRGQRALTEKEARGVARLFFAERDQEDGDEEALTDLLWLVSRGGRPVGADSPVAALPRSDIPPAVRPMLTPAEQAEIIASAPGHLELRPGDVTPAMLHGAEMATTTGEDALTVETVDQATCVVICALNSCGKTCIVWNAQRGGYEWPGGKMKEGETLIDAARRELKEETGLSFGVDDFEIDHIGRDVWILTVRADGEPKPQDQAGIITAAKWTSALGVLGGLTKGAFTDVPSRQRLRAWAKRQFSGRASPACPECARPMSEHEMSAQYDVCPPKKENPAS